tara:strand:+ start:567 stop:842 length:276 start_codon:yes stop_codon:yes gene_type:complete
MSIKNLDLHLTSVLLTSTAIEVDYTISLETDSFNGEVAGGRTAVQDSPKVIKKAEELREEVLQHLYADLGLHRQGDTEVDLLDEDDLEDPL